MSEFLDYDSRGKPVCFNHKLRVCGVCCVDFTFDDGDGMSGPVEGDYDDFYDFDPVSILVGSQARFIPQWDEQVLGPANTTSLRKDFQNPPRPTAPPALNFYFCSECGVNWLCGKAGKVAAQKHPSHHTHSDAFAGTSRSLVVYTDGACSLNGSVNAAAGIGIYFGPSSPYNRSEVMSLPGEATSQKAELFAVSSALQLVREQIVPARKLMCQGVTDIFQLRLIVATDSSYVVECICKHSTRWTTDASTGSLTNKSGTPIKNSAGFQRIFDEVEKLSQVGVQVVYYHLLRDHNRNADELAKNAVRRGGEELGLVSGFLGV